MSIADLLNVLPPTPNAPVSDVRWASVEQDIGTGLPSDYKAFVDAHGLGRLSDFIVVFTPFDANPFANLICQRDRELGALRELRDVWSEPSPYSLFPEPGGLLPFAATDNGDVLHWLTVGVPDRWPVVVKESRGPDYELHQCGMATFLAEVLTGRRRCSIFPQDLPKPVTFSPVR